jgi:hypothetical protein
MRLPSAVAPYPAFHHLLCQPPQIAPINSSKKRRTSRLFEAINDPFPAGPPFPEPDSDHPNAPPRRPFHAPLQPAGRSANSTSFSCISHLNSQRMRKRSRQSSLQLHCEAVARAASHSVENHRDPRVRGSGGSAVSTNRRSNRIF